MPSNAASAYAPEHLPYRKAHRLLSRGEKAVWHPLYLAVKGKYRIFCKVRLADIVRGPQHQQRYFHKIRGYHVDFVLCDPHTTAPLLVIELDDRGHRQARQQKRDTFKDQVLQAAGLPIYRIPAQQAYDPQELRERIRQLICMP